MNIKKTAILIFDSFQNEKGSGKSFLNSKKLQHQLTSSILKKAARSGIDYYHLKEDKQIGKTFGERFSNALSSIYKKGYDNLITVGNDIPNLKTSDLIRAKESLNNNIPVLGPTFDGGFYLLGLQKENFNALDFKNFSWNSSKVGSQVTKYISKFSSQLVTLNCLYDIDTFLDLKKVFATLSINKKGLRKVIQKIIHTFSDIIIPIEEKKVQLLVAVFYNKGSPALSL